MKSPCIAVPLKKAEEVKKALLDEGKLNKNLALEKEEEILYLPILSHEKENLILGYEVLERDFQVLEKDIKNYKELVDIPEELRQFLPTSFDIVGKVAIIKVQDEIQGYVKQIGEAILSANKSVETVALDCGVKGEERVRGLKIVAGKESTETVHKEYGIELETDPSKVYFSPRLATEHFRIAQMVKDDEVVIDMFCGIGPFSILMAKHRKPDKIYAIDINSDAIGYLKRNIKRNKVSNIVPLLGDSKVLVPDLEGAHRIVMNLPHSAFEFLSFALLKIKNNGVIHYYEVLNHESIDDRLEEIKKMANKDGITIILLGQREVHTYSPESSLYCLDLRVEKDERDI
ncbi:MAG: class I SAM-dependent methyltransferase family protein [Methanomassiliicoccales archaeon]|nr:MAG: class I SAM-dependent methyltransferase family protein [Methanomassiliicoccales archaeon]